MYTFDDISQNGSPAISIDMVPDFDNILKGVKYMTPAPFGRNLLPVKLHQETALIKWQTQERGMKCHTKNAKRSRRVHRTCVICPINDGAGEPTVLDPQSLKKIAAMFCVTRMSGAIAGDGRHIGTNDHKEVWNSAVTRQKNAFERMLTSFRKRFSRRVSPLA